MAVKDVTSYQAKVGRVQDADRYYVKDDGYFQWGDIEKTGLQMENALAYSNTIIGAAAGSTVLSITNYSVGLKHVWLSMTSTMTNASYAMVSDPLKGEDVYISLKQGSTASGLVTILFSGCSYVGKHGSVLASIALHNSGGSQARIHLMCFSDGEWTIVDFNNDATCIEA